MTLPARRRNYFIKKAFQAGFAVRFALLVLAEAVLIAGLFLYASRGTVTTGFLGGHFVVEKTSSFFLISLLLITCIAGVGIGLVGMLIFLRLSHQIAGPLYRFEKSLEEVAGGNLTYRFRLRQTDQLKDLAQVLNRFIEQLDQKMGRFRREVLESARLASGKTQPDNSSKLKESLDALQRLADSFKTSP